MRSCRVSNLSGHFTAENETYYCIPVITGGTLTTFVETAPVTVENAPPTSREVQIIPENPRPWDGLSADIVAYSIDSDYPEDPATVGYEIRWYRSQDGGETFVFKVEFSGVAPVGTSIPSSALQDGDIWRVVAIPFERDSLQGKAGMAILRVDGEPGWDQVYIGANGSPEVTIETPTDTTIADPDVTIAWTAEDPDDDAVTVDLYYESDMIPGGLIEIGLGLPASGSMVRTAPVPAKANMTLDLSGNDLVDAVDLFMFSARWLDEPKGVRYRIFARAWDEHGAISDTYSAGVVIVPTELPAMEESLLDILGAWRAR